MFILHILPWFFFSSHLLGTWIKDFLVFPNLYNPILEECFKPQLKRNQEVIWLSLPLIHSPPKHDVEIYIYIYWRWHGLANGPTDLPLWRFAFGSTRFSLFRYGNMFKNSQGLCLDQQRSFALEICKSVYCSGWMYYVNIDNVNHRLNSHKL